MMTRPLCAGYGAVYPQGVAWVGTAGDRPLACTAEKASTRDEDEGARRAWLETDALDLVDLAENTGA
jgi:hypothetical protein